MQEIRRRPLAYFFLFLCAAIFAGQSFPNHFFRPSDKDISRIVSDEEIFIGGKIISEVDERESFYNEKLASCILEAKKWWGADKIPHEVSGKVKVYIKNPPAIFSYGDELVIQGSVQEADGQRNPGGFNHKAYLERAGIKALFYSSKKFKYKILKSDQGFFLKAKAIEFKHFLSRKLTGSFDEETANFLKALFLGEQRDIAASFMDLFMNTGTVHILSVSGFHAGFVLLIVYSILKWFRFHRDIRLAAAILFVWAYSFIVGWQAPMVRACVMATFFMIGRIAGRKTDALNIIGAAGIVILFFRPLSILDVGFQLSFLTVTGLVLFMPVFVKKEELLPNEKWTLKEKIYFYIRDIFWGSFVCLVVSLPVTIQNFYIVTPSSLIANLIVIPLTFILFVLGFIFFLTFWWMPAFLSFIPYSIAFLLKVLTGSLFFIEHLPGAYFTVGRLHWGLWAVLTGGLLFLLLWPKPKKNWMRAVFILIFISGILLAQIILRGLDHRLKMTVLDVGQGDAIYFRLPNGKNLLMDAGKGGREGLVDKGRTVVAPFLKSEGVRGIDLLVISHPQEDHIGGLVTVFKEFRVRSVLESGFDYDSELYEKVRGLIRKEKSRNLKAVAGFEFDEFKEVKISILNPENKLIPDKNINNESVVLKVQYKNTSFLLTGDIQEQAMRNILLKGYDLKSTVLKVPHHGAKLTDAGKEFVSEVRPAYSLISVGQRNIYHHPHPDTLKALQVIPGNKVFRTDQDYAVQIISDGQELQVSLYRS